MQSDIVAYLVCISASHITNLSVNKSVLNYIWILTCIYISLYQKGPTDGLPR